MDKKSLLNNLKSAKKANVIKAGAKNEGTSTRKAKVTSVRYRKTKMMGPGI